MYIGWNFYIVIIRERILWQRTKLLKLKYGCQKYYSNLLEEIISISGHTDSPKYHFTLSRGYRLLMEVTY